MTVHVKLDGTAAHMRKGEVYVDVTMVQPKGYKAPALISIDLSDKTIRASILVPPTLVGRYPDLPIFTHFFLEGCDSPPKRFDLPAGPRGNLTMAGQLNLENGLTNTMNRICKIGIKIGMQDGDENVYEGDIYIDAVDW